MPKHKTLRFASILEESRNKLWGCHFGVPDSIARQLIDGSSRRVVSTLNDSAEHQCALVPHGNGSFVITVNKKLRDALGLKFGMTVHVGLRKDGSKYGLPMPEELEELFRQDAEGKRFFHVLTAGKQRTLLYIIGSAKNPESRISRSIVITKHLKANGGKVNYKQLNEALKKPNRAG
ncbi:MAG: DUF1905 domain-containing protein [Ignavibacteriae bacterium]|nr:DUF1905 domain-containing protein [Ignavibacteria bacterium]MBI3363395.1 DUF1905 domain-containing protein [Ignavibacteriota bacterium]